MHWGKETVSVPSLGFVAAEMLFESTVQAPGAPSKGPENPYCERLLREPSGKRHHLVVSLTPLTRENLFSALPGGETEAGGAFYCLKSQVW